MPDNENTPQDPQDPTGRDADNGGGEDTGNTQDWSALPDWARTEFEQTRQALAAANKEAAERRHKLNEYEERMKTLEQQRRQGMTLEERLKERESEIESLRQYEERAKTLEERIKESNEQRLAAIPDDMRALVPVDAMSPDQLAAYLDANESRLRKPTAPSLDGGAGGDGKRDLEITDADRMAAAVAQARGYKTTPEDAARRRLNKQ